MGLQVILTRISPTHHRLEYVRSTGGGESVELETKSFLFHDLLHFAVEMEAGLGRSFYGMLDSGSLYNTMSDTKMENLPADSEIGVTERIVGGLTGVIKHGADAHAFIDVMKNMFDAYGETVPAWLTESFIARVRERMRKLLGEWQALPFGQGMTLVFDVTL